MFPTGVFQPLAHLREVGFVRERWSERGTEGRREEERLGRGGRREGKEGEKYGGMKGVREREKERSGFPVFLTKVQPL